MTTISSPGIGSGLDVNSIISQLLAIERQPIDVLKAKSSKIQIQISEYGKLKGLIAAFRDASLKLTSNDTWGATVGTSSDSTAVGVTVKSGAAVGAYSLEVQALAKAQSLASGVFASADATPGAGTLRIELGAWGAGQASFTPKAGATAVDITVEATDTLAQVRDKINGANAGVTAIVFTDANGSRLLMRSSATGVENAFRTSGVSALAFDPSTGAAAMTQTEAASDAAATLNGLPIVSPSNTLINLVDGVTLTLGKVTTTPVEIKVVQDNESLKKAVQAFADSYNALNTLIAGQVKYDAATKAAGPLQGDSSAVGMQRQLRALMGTPSGASSVFTRLSDVGLEMQKDGSLSVTAGKLDTALANLPELKKLFANADLGVPGNNGLARQFRMMGDSLLSVDGMITTRSDGLRKRIEMNEDQQERLDLRVAQVEKRLRAQYTALDATLGRLSGIGSYVTQQMAALSGNNNNS